MEVVYFVVPRRFQDPRETKSLAEYRYVLSEGRDVLKNIPNVEMDTMNLMEPDSIDSFAERVSVLIKTLNIRFSY